MLVELPTEAASSDDGVRYVAARILHHGTVRAVTVDGERRTAVVRLRNDLRDATPSPGTPSSVDFALTSATDSLATSVDMVSWIDPTDQSITFIRKPASVRGWRRGWYLLLAAASLVLGLFGIVLPGLPTTPFVLLASFFLIRSSARLHNRLLASRIFGGVLRDWYVHRGLRPHVRARAVAVVAIVVALSLLVARPPWPAVVAIAALVACGLTVIWRLPTVRDDGAIRADK